MKTNADHLIKDLVSELKPIKVVQLQFSDILKVIIVGLLCVFASIATLGLRVDIAAQVLTLKFLFDTIVLLLLSILSIIAAFSLSIPSLKSSKSYRLPFFVFLLIVLATVHSFLTTSNPLLYLGHGFTCAYEIVSISILPAAILFYLVRRAAVLKRDIVGILTLMSGASFGLLGVQFTCIDSTSMHLFIWHILPATIVMGFGIWLARRLIKKI